MDLIVKILDLSRAFFMGSNFSKIDKHFLSEYFCHDFIFDGGPVTTDGLHEEAPDILGKKLLTQFFLVPKLANWNVQKSCLTAENLWQN